MTDRRRRWEQKNLAKGLCRRCGLVPIYETSRTDCILCLDRQYAHERRRQVRLMGEGRCRTCGKPRGDDGTTQYCGKHAALKREYSSRWNAKKRKQREEQWAKTKPSGK